MTVLGHRVEIDLATILFATDFSPSAESAKVYVKALARRYASWVRVIHVIDLSAAFQAPDAGVSIDVFRRIGTKSLVRLQAEMLADGIRTDTVLCEATDPSEEILQAAREGSVDLLVIGTRAHKGLAKLLLGSTAELLIHRAECPVLTIGPRAQPPEEPLGFRHIVYATDFSAEAAKAGVFALSFAEDSGSHIYLCHVLPASEESHEIDSEKQAKHFSNALQRLVPGIAREWCEPECILEHGHATDGILLLAHRVHADLIVLGTRRTSHWFDSLKSGVAWQVIGAAKCPVLTMRG